MPKRLALLGLLALASPAWAGFMAGPAPEIPDDVVLPVSTTPVGAVGVDAFTGWTNPADTAGNSTNWTSPSTSIRYLYPTNSTYSIATTVDSWRDVEVTTWVRNGCVLLRYVDGTAVFFTHFGESTNGTLTVGIRTGIQEGETQTTQCPKYTSGTTIYENSDLVGTVSGYSKTDTAGDTFTFGCAGWECYAEFNGVEFWRSEPDIRWPIEPGKVALSAPSTTYGFRDTSVDWLPLATINSRPAGQVYAMSDFRFYSVETTGSITSGSDELTVTSSAGYEVGDSVIVECGTESGACARNTTGVGGLWPAAHYADDATMDAAVPCTASSYAYLDDTGKVRRCNTGGTAWNAWDSTLYYTNYKVPRALSATITAIDGNVLTLDTTASATATSANVYRDSTPELDMFADGVGDSTWTPKGTYLFQDRIVLQGEIDLYLHSGTSLDNGVTVKGAGLNKENPEYTFFAPDGSPGITMTMGYQADYVTATGIYIRNNTGLSGFGLNWTASGLTGDGYPSGVKLELAEGSRIINSGALDSFGATTTSYCTNCYLTGSYARITDPQQIYAGWQIQQADSSGGEIRDAEVDSDYLIAGFEIFRSDDVDIINAVGRNAVLASNSSGGGWLMDNLDLTIEQNSQGSSSVTVSYPVVNINSNIQPPNPSMEEGGTIRNITLTNNYINVSNELMPGIVVNLYNPNITIEGTYPSCSSPKGLISYPATNKNVGAAISSTGEGTTITGIRADGTNANTTWGDISLTVNTGQSITDSVADNVTGIGTETDVITNSAYEALCPRRRRPANDNRRGVIVASRRRRTRLAA